MKQSVLHKFELEVLTCSDLTLFTKFFTFNIRRHDIFGIIEGASFCVCFIDHSIRYYISKRRLGDPAKECPKNYIYGFKCIRELETSQSGKFNYNEIEGVGGNLVEQKWDNTYCHRKRVPICQKPRGEIYDDQYIAVRASRTYQQAAQWCQTWYGTTLATIDSEKDNLKASAACRAMHVSGTRHCWIGLQRPYQRWDDGTDISKFESWAPGLFSLKIDISTLEPTFFFSIGR